MIQCSVLSCPFRADAEGVETLFSVYRIYGKQELQPRCPQICCNFKGQLALPDNTAGPAMCDAWTVWS